MGSLAAASVALALFSVALWLTPLAGFLGGTAALWSAPPVALAAVICGHLARRGGKRPGPALAALIVGYLELAFFALIFGFGYLAFRSIVQDLGAKGAIEASDKLGEHLLAGKISPRRVRGAWVIAYPEGSSAKLFEYEHLEWRPEFPGFRREILDENQARALLEDFRAGTIALESKAFLEAGHAEFKRRYEELRDRAAASARPGAVVFLLPRRKGAVISVLASPERAFFYTHGDAHYVRGFSETAAPALTPALARARPAVDVAFPELPAERALEKGRAEFGDIYARAIEYVRTTPEVISAVGPVSEIRPARSPNFAAGWMDFSADFTFKVSGPKGEAVVLARVMDENRELAMVHEDRLVEIPQRDFDWKKK